MPIPSLRGVLNLLGGYCILVFDKAKLSVRMGRKATVLSFFSSDLKVLPLFSRDIRAAECDIVLLTLLKERSYHYASFHFVN